LYQPSFTLQAEGDRGYKESVEPARMATKNEANNKYIKIKIKIKMGVWHCIKA
jgi:hypothetical protein